MTSRSASRFAWLAPSLFFAACIVLSGCATQEPRPTGPIYTGKPRVEPVPGQEAGVPDEGDLAGEPGAEAGTSGPYTPPFMAGRDLVRVGVMLPFSDRRKAVSAQAEGMLAAIELALFDHAGRDFVILPKDTRGSATVAAQMAQDLVNDGADLVLGPLFGENVSAARPILAQTATPIISFSNDALIAGNGVWLASVGPDEEVAEIIAHAALRGYQQFAFFGPQSELGQKIERTMQTQVVRNGGRMIATAFYPPETINPDTEAAYFARSVATAARSGIKTAVLVPERGNRLRRIAPLLAYHGIDTRRIKMLGTGGWDDPDIWREPSLNGAWFPAPPSVEVKDFNARYRRQYGRAPSSLASVAYDATAVAILLSADGNVTEDEMVNADGFAGVNGLFRFRPDGTAQRSLAIMEIDPSAETGVREIRPVAQSFTPPIG